MKQILSVLSTLTLTSSAALVLTSTVDNHMQQVKNDINWSDVKKSNSDYFKNLRQSQAKQKVFYTTSNGEVDINQVIDYAEQKSNQYFDQMVVQNLDLNQIINFLSQENSDFKATYENALAEQSQKNHQITLDFKAANYYNVQSSNRAIAADLSKGMESVKIAEPIFKTISAGAAIAAAGFWAAAWWFGITIPWAVGCSILSVSAGLIAAALNEAILFFDPAMNQILREIELEENTRKLYELGARLYQMLYEVLIAGQISVTSEIWAFPPAAIATAVIGVIIDWVMLYW
ncbi:hypothetical protein LT336_00646 [Spiroplasma sp. JKS002671]|uniref:hypothetical protein n=1 Tax=Spiroplasma attinicola TaxID=2904537 RepID=UPI002022AE4B|nr:hypothetical protein [Spiroplasma sp. JKS002671]MCL8210902.1 hypothetical protein [Spiroplasma sp. JKS002671]